MYIIRSNLFRGYVMNKIYSWKKLFVLATSMSLFGIVGCHSFDSSQKSDEPLTEIKDGKLKDPRDGNEYNVALIGGVYWMTENLRYADSTSMKNLKGNSWCYENDKKECEKNGRLYSWTAAMDLDSENVTKRTGFSNQHYRGICPSGWRIPSSQDWNSLLQYVESHNGGEGAGTSLKSVDGWEKSDESAIPTNRFGFDATASGRRNNDDETFMKAGKYAFFWSSSEYDDGTSNGWQLRHDLNLLQEGHFYKDHGLSVRCITVPGNVIVDGALDSSYLEKIPHQYGSLKYDGQTYRTVEINGATWMADNLNKEVKGSHCYNDESDNCKEFGRLYTLATAKEICPEGWRLPTYEDFSELIKYSQTSAAFRSTSGWTSKASKGLNFWGFDAKPAGGRDAGDFFDLKTSAYFWIDDEVKSGTALVLWINYYDDETPFVPKTETSEFSVRCVKAE